MSLDRLTHLIPDLTGDATQDIKGLHTALFDILRKSVRQPLIGTTLNLTGGQIRFPASANTSSNANTLDDYEEGTWTPTIAGSTTPGAQTYSTNTGRYTKIGRLVTVEAAVVMTAKDGTTAGNLLVSGFPFAEGGGAIGGFGIGYHANLTLGAGYTQVGLFFNAAGTSANLVKSGTGAAAAFLVAADLAAASAVLFSGSYSV